MNTVVTFLWKDVQDFDKYEHPFIENKKWFKERGDVYDMSYVNKLFSSIRRNTTHPVECVLITDYENTDTNADRIIPMWSDYREYGRCYCRLKLFDKSMQDIIANRFTWIDIDVIIKDNIDWLFEFVVCLLGCVDEMTRHRLHGLYLGLRLSVVSDIHRR